MAKQKVIDALRTSDYDFLKTNKYLGNNVLMLSLGGSMAYGTDIETSDIDVRGFTLPERDYIFGLSKDFEQVVDTTTDTVIYSLPKMMQLLCQCNPNTIEILGVRDEEIIYKNKWGQMVLDNKENFLSKIAIDKFGGYARQQFDRLEHGLLGNGANTDKEFDILKHSLNRVLESFNIKHSDNALDLNIRLIDRDVDTDLWNGMRHGDKANSVGQDLIISGSLTDYPVTEFKTLISEIHKTQSSFGQLNKRNTKKTDTKLAKHMMHLIRLFLMGIDLNRYGKIVTYREKEHELLMNIRNGNYMYHNGMKVRMEFYDILNKVQNEYDEAIRNTVLPDKPNTEALNELTYQIYKEAFM